MLYSILLGFCCFFSLVTLYTVARTPWTGDQHSEGLYLHPEHKHGINAHNTVIHALSGIRAHDPRVRGQFMP
jgi:hypothetical protein